MLSIELNPGIPGTRWAWLRPLCGKDELLVQQGAREEVLSLLQQLLVSTEHGGVPPERARDLPVCDVDRLLALLYRHYLGDRIESTSNCVNCGQAFEISFSLAELVQANDAAREEQEVAVAGPDEDGIFDLPDGRRFRLPSTRDLDAVVGIEPSAAAKCLRQACTLEGDPEQHPESLDAAMAAVGPVLDTDLDVVCPSCEQAQQVRFEIQNFMGRVLAMERQFLNHEVHQLARAYGWSRAEILLMTRKDRREHVRMVLAERSAVSRHRVAAS